MKCSECGAYVIASEKECPFCGGPLVEENEITQSVQNNKQPVLDMGWYKAIRLLIIAWAAYCVYCGYRRITGEVYGLLKQWMYESYRGLDTIDLIFGIAYICVAVFMVFAAIRLWRFCKNGPRLLISAQYIYIALPVLYDLVTVVIYKLEFM